jgi:lipoprotein-releasing system permease protein
MVGICGAFFGLIAGYLVCLYLQSLQFMNVTPSNPTGHLHISLSYGIYVQAVLMSIFSASMASILPAWSAGKLTPIEVIRQGG